MRRSSIKSELSPLFRGVYAAIFRLRRPRRLHVGRLGALLFPAGLYVYVGSAQRNLPARLRRHGLRHKPLRWHIDYLSIRAELIGAVVVRGPKTLECKLAAKLAQFAAQSVPAFGCTDCCCRSHLFRL